ncbi:MAG: DUF2520 domain-containing protein [Thermaerobacter sp.]|nr:DUF2520 domain-containing protein [Thermaerobacter sp.]
MERAAIVGPGRVGTALALALRGLQDVLGATGGHPQTQQRFAEATHLPLVSDAAALCRSADWIYLTVPDGRIADVCASLARDGALRKGQVVCHTSGVLDAGVLAPAKELGAQVLSLHPMQAIARPQAGREAFAGAICTVQGDDPAAGRAEQLVRSMAMTPLRISSEQKPRLHAAAALASNALVGLLAVAAEAAAGPKANAAEREEALRLLLPLAEGTLKNVFAVGIPMALTGAVERGDLGTVILHLSVLVDQPAEVYRTFLPVLARLAAEKQSTGAGRPEEISQLLAEVRDRWPNA